MRGGTSRFPARTARRMAVLFPETVDIREEQVAEMGGCDGGTSGVSRWSWLEAGRSELECRMGPS